jgi:hypothetical protein
MSLLPRSARFSRLLLAAAPVLSLVQACGRSEPGDYLYDDDGLPPSSGSGGGSSGGRPSKGGTSSTAGASVGGKGIAGQGVAGTSIGGTGIGGTGVGGTAVGGTSTMGGKASGGAAGEPSPPDMKCGAQFCNPSTQRCCAGVAGFSCIANNQDCNGAVLECTAAGDCSGDDICCLTFASPPGSASACRNECTGMGAGRDRQLCSTDAECSGNRSCVATVFGVSVCARVP